MNPNSEDIMTWICLSADDKKKLDDGLSKCVLFYPDDAYIICDEYLKTGEHCIKRDELT